MYFLLILFFTSLIGITVMVGRKLSLARNGQVIEIYHSHPFVPDLNNIRRFVLKNIKRFLYVALFIIIKLYVKSSNFLKSTYNEVKIKIKNKGRKNHTEERKEISKFLEIISDYKHKIREIKNKIKEEENSS